MTHIIENFAKSSIVVNHKMTDEFTRHFFKHFIAKFIAMNEGGGFSSVSDTALEIFTDAVIYRIQKYAREIRNLVEFSGRTEPNGYDVFNVLWRYRENMTTLASYLIDKGQSFEIQVKEYPIQQSSRFYSRYTQSADLLPFRTGAPFIGYDMSATPLPHIPRFFPSPFGEKGISIEDGVGGENSNLMRRQNDVDTIISEMKEYVPPVQIPPEIKMESCKFIDQLINSVIGDSAPQEAENNQ